MSADADQHSSYRRRKSGLRELGSIAYDKQGLRRAVHALLPIEQQAVLSYVCIEETI
jgi:hypothetical protein